jgi:hypothetical protein
MHSFSRQRGMREFAHTRETKMKKKIDPILLGSLAIMSAALVGGMAFFAPVFAQSPMGQYSTPGQVNQSILLNQGTVTTQSPMNGQAPGYEVPPLERQGPYSGYPQDRPAQNNPAYPQNNNPNYQSAPPGSPQTPDSSPPKY